MSTTDTTTLRALAADLLSFLDLYRVDRYGEGPDGLDEDGPSIGYGSLDPATCPEDADAVSLGVLIGSDYSGGSVVRANVREVETMAEDEDSRLSEVVLSTYGGYGTAGVLFLLDRAIPEEDLSPVVDLLRGLLDYPCVSDEAVSEIESEDEAEAWENYARRDFASALADRIVPGIGSVSVYVDEDDTRGDDLRELFHVLADKGNHNGGPGVVHEETGPYFMVEEVAGEASPVLLFALRLATVDAEEALDVAAQGDEDDRAEACRLRRLVRLGDGLQTIEEGLRREYLAEQDRRRREDPERTSSVHERARAVEEAEARRVARETILRAEIDAGDTDAALSPDLPRAQRVATVRLVRYQYGTELGLSRLETVAEIDPEDRFHLDPTADLASLFRRPSDSVKA